MKSSRHRSREVALQVLYRYDAIAHESGTPPPEGMALAQDIQKHFDHFTVPEGYREFSALLVAGTLQNLTQLDELLQKHATHWRISRMSSIDRSLLRMAAYELTHIKETPATVTIDEAIELGKQFGSADSAGFINGILDAIKQSQSSASDG